MPNFICTTCGTQHAESATPPDRCAICDEPRQYVKPSGQQWTTLEQLRRTHKNTLRAEEPGLISLGVEPHFAGGTVLHWGGGAAGRGVLLSGDILQVVPDRKHVSFMYSYPNHIPLGAAAVRRAVAAVEPFAYDRVYGAFWDMTIERDGKGA